MRMKEKRSADDVYLDQLHKQTNACHCKELSGTVMRGAN